MKKRILLIAAMGALGSLVFSSYEGGPALNGQIRNGTKGSPTSCGQSGCHGTGAGTTSSIRVDSVGAVQVTRYVPAMTYTITVGGTNTTGLTNFGFQHSAVSGTGSSQVQAGTFSGFPTGVTTHTASSVSFVEQTTALAGPGGVFSKTFTWTAPTTNVGNVTMYLTVNAVNNNNNEDAADVSGNSSIVLSRIAPTSVAGISSSPTINAYPNPVFNNLNLQLTNAGYGNYTIALYDLMGKQVAAQNVEVTGASATVNLDASNWAPGMYNAVITKDGERKVVQVVKQ